MKRASDVPPVGAELGRHPRHLRYRRGDEPAQRSGRGEKGNARDLDHEIVVAAHRIEAAAQPGLEALRRVQVVEADVEARRGLARDHVVRRVADVDARDLERGGLEIAACPRRAAALKRADSMRTMLVRGVVGEVGIGGMALGAAHRRAGR